MRAGHVARHILNAAMDFCFPGSCAACRAACDGSPPLCVKCLTQLDALATAPACGKCAEPLAYPDAPCPHCRGAGSRPFERIVALGIYDHPVRQLIHQIKYHRAWHWADVLTDRLLETERAKALLHETDVLVPIPLHPLRRLSRGYNQAELIAWRLGKACHIKVASPLIRVRATETQTHLHSAAKREANLKGAFGLDSHRAVRGKHVVLVDDVKTTGATARAAATALRPAKPASVSLVTWALADPRHRGFETV